MNRKPSELALVAVSLVCILILAACSSSTPFLRYIVISPTSATIPAGTTQQFTATGYYSNGATTPGLSVTWASSSTSVATIDSASGIAIGVANGTTSITATAFGVTSSPATLTVEAIVSIAVTPANQTVTPGATIDYQATGTYSNPSGGAPIVGTDGDLTAQVTWSATPATLATFSSTTPGEATAGTTAGSGTVSAALAGVTGTTKLTVQNGPVSLVISPATATIAVGNSTALVVQEKWNDGSMHAPAAGAISWSSDTTNVANVVGTDVLVGAGTGTAAAFAAGTANITACEMSGGTCSTTVTATTALTVTTGSKHYGYVSNIADQAVQYYSVDPTKAPYFTSLGTVSTVPDNPFQTVFNPNAKYVYVIGTSTNTYAVTYSVSSTGGIGTPGTPQLAGLGNSNYGVVDPYGRFLYVTDTGSGSGTYPNGTLYGFTIQSNGSLTPIASAQPFTTNLNSPEIALIDHTGSYLYVTNYGTGTGNGTVSVYSIDQNTGALTPLSSPNGTVATGQGPFFGTMDPTGSFLYVANNTDGTISGYSIGSGGVLTSLGTALTVTGASSVLNAAVTPNGQYLYVLDSGPSTTNGQVFGFALTAGVPSTTPVGPAAQAGLNPVGGIVVDSTGSIVAVENEGDGTNPGNISIFTIGSGGVLTAQTPVAAGINANFVTLLNLP